MLSEPFGQCEATTYECFGLASNRIPSKDEFLLRFALITDMGNSSHDPYHPAFVKRDLLKQGFALCICVSLLVFIWFVTYGTWNLFDTENLGQFYDGQARSLLHGRWDIEFADITPEEFVHDGKYYGYFGFVPAIPRIALNSVLPNMYGSWSRVSLTLGFGIMLWLVWRLLHRAAIASAGNQTCRPGQRVAYLAFVLASGLGSIALFLGSRSFVYHEAAMWGLVCTLACFDRLLAYETDRRASQLACAGALALLAFFCRTSIGCGPLAALCLVALRDGARGPRRTNSIIAMAFVGLTIGLFVAINHAKFGTWFEAIPMQYYAMMGRQPERIARSGGVWMRLGNVPTTFCAYFSPTTVRFDRHFPWVFATDSLRVFSSSRMDEVQPIAGIIPAMPGFAFLSIIGVASIRRLPMPVLFGSICCFVPTLLFNSVEQRYETDIFPLLILLAALGLHRLLRLGRPSIACWATRAVMLLLLLQIPVNAALALYFQRVCVFGVPLDRRVEMFRWSAKIDSALLRH